MIKFGTNASGAIWWANLQLMQLAPSGGQIWNQYVSGASGGKIGNQFKWRHLVAKFATNSRSATEIDVKLFYEWSNFLAERLTQLIDSIPWFRCVSGKADDII